MDVFLLFLQDSLPAIVLSTILTGIVGTFLVCRRMVFIGGGITHASFGGLGLGLYLSVPPVLMAAVFALAGGMVVETLRQRKGVRTDTIIAAIWSLGMALGVLFTYLTPGYSSGLASYLFGNVLLVSSTDLLCLGVFTVLLLLLLPLFYHRLLFLSFDPEYAYTRRYGSRMLSYGLMAVSCVALVLCIRVMGIMLLMSMISLPQMIVGLYAEQFSRILRYSVLLSVACGLSGLLISYWLGLPTSACIILLLTVIYLGATLLSYLLRQQRLRSLLRG